jgi:hypothetical protein
MSYPDFEAAVIALRKLPAEDRDIALAAASNDDHHLGKLPEAALNAPRQPSTRLN